MSKELHRISLPAAIFRNDAGYVVSVEVSREDAKDIRAQCDRILADKPQREWQEADVVDAAMSSRVFRPYICVSMLRGGKWVHEWYPIGNRGAMRHDDDVEIRCGHFRFNLHNLLVQGRIVVSLTEEEAEHIVSPHHHDELCVTCSSVFNRLSAALARYRENQKEE